MSLDIQFNKNISLMDISSKIDGISIHEENNSKWLVDKFGNSMYVKEKNYVDCGGNLVNPPTLELTSYGSNNPTFIMDSIIKEFQTKFITDNEVEILYHEKDLNIDEMYDRVMDDYGYLKDGNIIIPKRNDDDYKSPYCGDPEDSLPF